MSNAFPYTLTVIHDFENYHRGDQITDDAECQRIADGENAHHCHRVTKLPAAVPTFNMPDID